MPGRTFCRQMMGLGYALGLSVLAFAGVHAGAQTATKPEPISNVITVSPSTTVRGSSFDIAVQGAPSGTKTVGVELDGRRLPPPVFDPQLPGILHARVPDSVDPGSTEFVPLGTHRVSVMYNNRWFTGGTALTVVRPEQTTPVLHGAVPLEIGRRQADRKLVLTGSNFLADAPDDNQVFLGGLPLPVVWDGCESSSSWAQDKKGLAHGRVDPTGSSMTLCNFPSSGLAPEILIRQGDRTSQPITLHVPPWSKSRIVLASVLVNLLAASLIIWLASFVRKSRIGNERYGTFRTLFLDPETNTYSLSKYQFYMWTGAAVFTYAYFAISRIFVQQQLLPDVPSTLPAIIGIGAGTAIGSQLVTGIRGPKGGGPEKPSLGDFVASGGVAAPDRVQMFVWTTLGVVAFCLATLRAAPWDITGLPAMGSGLMYLMGLSSVGYLGGKLARKPGPVLSEISISPGQLGSGVRLTGPDGAALPDLSQPVAQAQQVALQTRTMLSSITKTSSPVAFQAAQDALKALQLSIAAAGAPNGTMLATMSSNAITADAAARTAAADFNQSAGATGDESRQFAELAQECAAAAQDLASGSAQAAGVAQAQAAEMPPETPALRTIDLRGRNLSQDATFEINDTELPFRMLAPVNGAKAPRLVAPEEDAGLPNMARELQLLIAPDALGVSDRKNYDLWFSRAATALKLSITNPDGQRSEISFTVPPGSSQANS